MDNCKKWNIYLEYLQSHPSVCKSTIDIATLKPLLEIMPPERYRNVLNIGAGEGLETSILKQLGYNPTGIVRGDANLRWAKENYKDIVFIDCDMHDLPFKSGSFDAIYTSQVLEHAFAPFIFLLESYCVLKENGLFYISIPKLEERNVPNNPGDMNVNWITHHHPSLFSPNIWVQMFEKCGFEVMKRNADGTVFVLRRLNSGALHSDINTALLKRNQLV